MAPPQEASLHDVWAGLARWVLEGEVGDGDGAGDELWGEDRRPWLLFLATTGWWWS